MNKNLESALWAYKLMQSQKFVVIDTETTGKENDDQICQMGWCSPYNPDGWQVLVKPTIPINAAAIAIHRITDAMVSSAPPFEAAFVELLKEVGDRDVIFFNADFDLRLMRQSAKARGFQLAFPTSDRRQCRIFTNGGSIHCAMLHYAKWVGEWDFTHNSYKFQSLPKADHTALGDAQATLELISKMADSYTSSPEDEDLIPY